MTGFRVFLRTGGGAAETQDIPLAEGMTPEAMRNLLDGLHRMFGGYGGNGGRFSIGNGSSEAVNLVGADEGDLFDVVAIAEWVAK